ncbi:MAG: hypothetical protein WC150_03925 [Bacteroidia bacterium]
MIKPIFFICGFLLLISESYSQSQESSKLMFEVNYVGRFATLQFGQASYGGIYSSMYPFVNVADQLNGSGLNLGLSLSNKKGWGFKYSTTFRYDHIYHTTIQLDSTQRYGQGINVQGLITDYHFSLTKQLRQSKRVKGELALTYSMMNTGTGFTAGEYLNGIGIITVDKDFRFDTWALHYSAGIDKFKIGLGVYYGKSSAYWGLDGTYIIPELRIGYVLDVLGSKKEGSN